MMTERTFVVRTLLSSNASRGFGAFGPVASVNGGRGEIAQPKSIAIKIGVIVGMELKLAFGAHAQRSQPFQDHLFPVSEFGEAISHKPVQNLSSLIFSDAIFLCQRLEEDAVFASLLRIEGKGC